MTYQRIQDDEDEDLGQDKASEPIQRTDASFRVCGCTNTVADRIGFAIRGGRRYEDGELAWYVHLQGQGETGLYTTLHYKSMDHPERREGYHQAVYPLQRGRPTH